VQSPHPIALPDELSLSKLWNSGRLPRECRCADGRRLEVVYRGQWSRGYGPDFRGAILSFDGAPPARGDVEIHVRSSGWTRHGHDGDPLYTGVILHVVWSDDHPTRLGVPVLQLCDKVTHGDLQDLPDPGDLDASLCAVFRSEESARGALRTIEAAGDARFEARCAAYEGDLACASPEQALYAGLMECMGYAENKLPFRLLAEALPYDVIASRDADRIARALQEGSGLVPGYERCAALRPEQWRVARVRPANHPLRRMNGLARLIARAEGEGGLAMYVAAAVPAGPRALLDRLRVGSPEGPALIGPDRAGEAACNAALPFAVALARATGDADLETAARAAWERLPRASLTRVERSMRDHLGAPSGRLLNRARHQQGLLHLYRRYCAQRLCAACPLSKLAGPE
jgi:hypothetical protein